MPAEAQAMIQEMQEALGATEYLDVTKVRLH